MFDLPIVCYLFLGGAGGGVGCFAALAGFAAPLLFPVTTHTGSLSLQTLRLCRKTLAGLLSVAAAILLLGCMCLLVDLGGLNQLAPLLTQPRWSYITFGSYLLPTVIILDIVLLLCWQGCLFQKAWWGRRGAILRKILHSILFALCFGIVVYTGLFLASIKAVPLWHCWCLPVLFILSSMSCGVVLSWVVFTFTNTSAIFGQILRKTLALDTAVLLLEVLLLGIMLMHVASEAGCDTATQRAAAQSLLWFIDGEGGPWLFGGLIGLGLLIPGAVEIVFLRRIQISSYGMLFVAVCVLIGAFLLRWIIVEAGVPPILFG